MTDEERAEDRLDRLERRVRGLQRSWSMFARQGARNGVTAHAGSPAGGADVQVRAAHEGGQLRVPWGRLTAEQLKREWDGLIAWVAWAIPAYSVTEWPPCWAEHEGLVAHIDGLRRWHQAVYDGDSDGSKVTAWHESFQKLVALLRTHSLCGVAADKSGERARESTEAAAQIRDAHVASRGVVDSISGARQPGDNTGT